MAYLIAPFACTMALGDLQGRHSSIAGFSMRFLIVVIALYEFVAKTARIRPGAAYE